MSGSESDFDVVIVIVGDSGVGKTSLLHTFKHSTFPEEGTYDTYSKYSGDPTTEVKGRKIEFHDTQNNPSKTQDQRDRILSYNMANAVLICYDVSNPESLTHASETWIVEVNYHTHSIPYFLVGLKTDLPSAVSEEDAKAVAAQCPKIQKSFLLSAKESGSEINAIFNEVAEAALAQDAEAAAKRKEPLGNSAGLAGKKSDAGRAGGGGGRRGCNLL